MTDIVERLRKLDDLGTNITQIIEEGFFGKVADEIERLRAHLRLLVNEFADYHYHGCDESSETCCFAQILIKDAKAVLL